MNYSFIIPHKNSLDLLLRCVNSIPIRDDIQIIVVDDNSGNVDWEHFSFTKENSIELYLTHEGKGAGYARNVGLEHAKGRWLVFADCDDFFEDGFMDIIDSYKDSDADVVYYNAKSVDSETLKPIHRIDDHREYINNAAIDKNAVEWMKYHLHSPWWKMVKRSFVQKYGFKFEEIPNGNDIMWSFQIAYFANNIEICTQEVYNYTFTKNSITTRKNFIPKYLCRIENKIKTNYFFDYIGHPEWKRNVIRSLFSPLKKEGPIMFLKVFVAIILNFSSMYRKRNYYVEVVKNKK